MQNELKRKLKELEVYKQQHDNWMHTMSQIIDAQASLDTKMDSRMGYEQFKIQTSPDGRGQDCVQYEQLGHKYLSCHVRHEQDKHEHLFERMEQGDDDGVVLDRLLKSFQARIESIGGPASSSATDANDTKKRPRDEHETLEVEMYVEDGLADPHEPTKPPKYAAWPETLTLGSKKDAAVPDYDRPDWPTEADCDTEWISRPPQWNEYPTVFLSPENKGFE